MLTRTLDRFLRNRILGRLREIRSDLLVLNEGEETLTLGGHAGRDSLRAEVFVNDPRFWRAVATGGAMGAGEAYLREWWDADDLTAALRIFVRHREVRKSVDGVGAKLMRPFRRLAHRFRRNTRAGSRKNIHDHYDLGNDFFALFLDETMTYSAAIFPRPGATLEEAQVEKLDRICRKLDLSPRDHVLEIGTGWGSFAIHAARQYGARVTTTTISKEQFELATRRIAEAGVADRVEVLRSDYRDLEGRYDKVVSIEMIEAVGHDFYDDYFGKIGSLLAEDGLALIQAIVMPDREYERYRRSVDFIQRHVFPGSCLPSIGAMNAAVARTTDLRVLSIEEFGPHYATTLRMWRERFGERTFEAVALGYPDRLLRMWEYYLAYCEAGFAERYIGDVHLLLAGARCRTEPALPRHANGLAPRVTGEGVFA